MTAAASASMGIIARRFIAILTVQFVSLIKALRRQKDNHHYRNVIKPNGGSLFNLQLQQQRQQLPNNLIHLENIREGEAGRDVQRQEERIRLRGIASCKFSRKKLSIITGRAIQRGPHADAQGMRRMRSYVQA